MTATFGLVVMFALWGWWESRDRDGDVEGDLKRVSR